MTLTFVQWLLSENNMIIFDNQRNKSLKIMIEGENTMQKEEYNEAEITELVKAMRQRAVVMDREGTI